MPEDSTEAEVLQAVADFNANPDVDSSPYTLLGRHPVADSSPFRVADDLCEPLVHGHGLCAINGHENFFLDADPASDSQLYAFPSPFPLRQQDSSAVHLQKCKRISVRRPFPLHGPVVVRLPIPVGPILALVNDIGAVFSHGNRHHLLYRHGHGSSNPLDDQNTELHRHRLDLALANGHGFCLGHPYS